MNQDTQNFKRAFLKLNGTDAKSVRDAITTRCNYKGASWHQKINGIRGFSINEHDIIESIFRAYNLDAWTGNKINSPEICTS